MKNKKHRYQGGDATSAEIHNQRMASGIVSLKPRKPMKPKQKGAYGHFISDPLSSEPINLSIGI